MARGRPSREDVYLRLHTQIEELWTGLGGLPTPGEAGPIWLGIWLEEAHHSTALEGNTLVLKQVAELLAEGRAVGDKQLAEYMEVRGYASAAEWVYQQGLSSHEREPGRELMTVREVRDVHAAALRPVWDVAPHDHATPAEGPGSFREHDIHPFPEGMTPPAWPLVAAEVTGWVERVNRLVGRQVELPERVAVLHADFERVHPFLDGNGRTGRLLLNLILVRLGYPPAILYRQQRAAYLRALRRADDGEPGVLGELIARAVLDNLYRFVVPAVAGPARLVLLGALADARATAAALRVAANRGVLQATKGPDGQWRSSRAWVEEYLQARYRRRP